MPETRIGEIVPRRTRDELNTLRDGPGIAFLAYHLGAMAGTGWLLRLALGMWWTVPAMLAHGYVIAALFGPFHETAHRSAFRSRWLNESVFWVSGVAIFYLKTIVFQENHSIHL